MNSNTLIFKKNLRITYVLMMICGMVKAMFFDLDATLFVMIVILIIAAVFDVDSTLSNLCKKSTEDNQ